MAVVASVASACNSSFELVNKEVLGFFLGRDSQLVSFSAFGVVSASSRGKYSASSVTDGASDRKEAMRERTGLALCSLC